MTLTLYRGNNYYNRKIMHAETDLEYVDNLGFTWLASV